MQSYIRQSFTTWGLSESCLRCTIRASRKNCSWTCTLWTRYVLAVLLYLTAQCICFLIHLKNGGKQWYSGKVSMFADLSCPGRPFGDPHRISLPAAGAEESILGGGTKPQLHHLQDWWYAGPTGQDQKEVEYSEKFKLNIRIFLSGSIPA